jgi:hypothetical protein
MNAVLVALALLLAPAMVFAGKADVVKVEVVEDRGDQWTFVVTVRHDDKDPDHWADWWIVRTPKGQELGRRVLFHSHTDEQPFTRDETIRIPRDVTVVVVEAHDKVHGYGGKIVTVDLTKPAGPGYTVKRAR